MATATTAPTMAADHRAIVGRIESNVISKPSKADVVLSDPPIYQIASSRWPLPRDRWRLSSSNHRLSQPFLQRDRSAFRQRLQGINQGWRMRHDDHLRAIRGLSDQASQGGKQVGM